MCQKKEFCKKLLFWLRYIDFVHTYDQGGSEPLPYRLIGQHTTTSRTLVSKTTPFSFSYEEHAFSINFSHIYHLEKSKHWWRMHVLHRKSWKELFSRPVCAKWQCVRLRADRAGVRIRPGSKGFCPVHMCAQNRCISAKIKGFYKILFLGT